MEDTTRSKRLQKITKTREHLQVSQSLTKTGAKRLNLALKTLKTPGTERYRIVLGQLLQKGGSTGLLLFVAALTQKELAAKGIEHDIDAEFSCADGDRDKPQEKILGDLAKKYNIPDSLNADLTEKPIAQDDAVVADSNVGAGNSITKGYIQLEDLQTFLNELPRTNDAGEPIRLQLEFPMGDNGSEPSIRLNDLMCQKLIMHAQRRVKSSLDSSNFQRTIQ